MMIFSRIRRQLFRTYFRIGAHIHVRHWRGHGVHSPFMYAIVRQVFMKNHLTGGDRTLYNELRKHRISKKHCIVLQNLYTHTHSEKFLLLDRAIEELPSCKLFCILTSTATNETIATIAQQAAEAQAILVLLGPHRSGRRWKIAQQIPQHHPCVSVDRRLMMLYFFNPKLQPQHYQI